MIHISQAGWDTCACLEYFEEINRNQRDSTFKVIGPQKVGAGTGMGFTGVYTFRARATISINFTEADHFLINTTWLAW